MGTLCHRRVTTRAKIIRGERAGGTVGRGEQHLLGSGQANAYQPIDRKERKNESETRISGTAVNSAKTNLN